MVVYYNRHGAGRFELAMQLTAIGLVSLNSNSETHMTAICDARLIYGRGRISPVFRSCGHLTYLKLNCFMNVPPTVSDVLCLSRVSQRGAFALSDS